MGRGGCGRRLEEPLCECAEGLGAERRGANYMIVQVEVGHWLNLAILLVLRPLLSSFFSFKACWACSFSAIVDFEY